MPALTWPAPPRAAPPSWLIYASVFLGGTLGGSLRYGVGLVVPPQPGQVPWGIAGVNVSGAFVLALLLAGWVRRGHLSHPWRPFLATGILGSFTTWSTFMADTLQLVRDGHVPLGTAYLVGATLAGVGAAALGWWVAQRTVPHVGEAVA